MDSWFKGTVVAIGVFLGILQPREAPVLDMRAHRDAAAIYLSLELMDMPGLELEKIVQSSFALRLTLKARAGGREASAWREVRFDGKYYEVRVSESGKSHRTADAAAAWAIATRFGRIPLGSLEGLAYPLECAAQVFLTFPEDKEYDPMMVWAYHPASAFSVVDGLGSVPYY